MPEDAEVLEMDVADGEEGFHERRVEEEGMRGKMKDESDNIPLPLREGLGEGLVAVKFGSA
jgi:hypothetical protein